MACHGRVPYYHWFLFCSVLEGIDMAVCFYGCVSLEAVNRYGQFAELVYAR